MRIISAAMEPAPPEPPTLLASDRSAGLSGRIAMPGDKSISHRALILAAMAEGTSRLTNLSEAMDVVRTGMAIAALGAKITHKQDCWLVTGRHWRTSKVPIDCGNSGTAARLLLGALAGRGTKAQLIGDESLARRPMARLIDPLRRAGASIEGGDTLPLATGEGAMREIRHLNRPASAQVKSALLLAAIGAGVAAEIVEPEPTRDHLERMLPFFGVDIAVERDAGVQTVRVPAATHLTAGEIDCPGDLSAAAFPLVAALLCEKSAVEIVNVGVNPLRTGLLDTLNAMGADIRLSDAREQSGEPVATLHAHSSPLRGTTVPTDRVPRMVDEYPILAIAAACAEGETVMHGLAELRVKESDRLAALVEGLTACGVSARIEGDTLRVTGGRVPGGATVATHGDHRIAMAFLVLGLVSDAPIRVDGAEMIATSFPGFAETMRGLGARIAAA